MENYVIRGKIFPYIDDYYTRQCRYSARAKKKEANLDNRMEN